MFSTVGRPRLVFNGKHQNEHGDTYSPTPTLTTIRLMLATCCTPEWNVTHWDLSNAFCGTPLEGKEVYIIPPKGTPGIDPDEMWRIKKAINGLKDSNRLFYEYLQSHILSFSSTTGYVFKKNSAEPCMYVCIDKNNLPLAYVAGYVDDLITTDETVNQHLSKELIEHLQAAYRTMGYLVQEVRQAGLSFIMMVLLHGKAANKMLYHYQQLKQN